MGGLRPPELHAAPLGCEACAFLPLCATRCRSAAAASCHRPRLPAPSRLAPPQIAAQLAANPLCSGILRVRCTQLHGPSLLLLGDAGHAVSPSTGNGMNSALEDAWLMGQVRRAGVPGTCLDGSLGVGSKRS